MPAQINVNSKVNSQSIRRETYNGREHVVIPSYTLPANVIMNREFYPEAEIAANYQSMEGTIAPLVTPQLTVKTYRHFLLRVFVLDLSAHGTGTLA